MAPPNQLGKRLKGVQVHRNFSYGTIAKPFDEKHNPKPPGVPDDHTHSWYVFIKGPPESPDLSHWLRRVQFKLHESIPNHVRMVDAEPDKPFVLHETGWGDFEITIKFYNVTESGEKPLTLYHNLRLHPYGTDDEKEAMRAKGEVEASSFDQQVFSDPFEAFYEIFTTGAHPLGHPPPSASGKGKGKGKGKSKGKPLPPLPDPKSGVVWNRTAMLPARSTPGWRFSHELEDVEIKKYESAREDAIAKLEETQKLIKTLEEKLAAGRKKGGESQSSTGKSA